MKNNTQKLSRQIIIKMSYIIYSMFIFVYLITLNDENSNRLFFILMLFIISYVIYSLILGAYLKEYIFIDFNFIFLSIFLLYSIIGPLYYIIFDAKFITYEVYSGIDVVQKTLIQYFGFFIIFSSMTFFKTIKKETLNIEINKIGKFSFITDFIAFMILSYWIFLIVSKVGVNIFSLDKSSILDLIGENKVITYGDYFMISYTVYYFIFYINKYFYTKKLKSFVNLKIFIILAYYLSNIIIGNRRSFLILMIMTFVLISNYIIKSGKFKYFKYLFIIVGVLVIFLLAKGITREVGGLGTAEYKYTKFFGEFVYNQWVSYYYVNDLGNSFSLYNGITFFLYPIIFLFPSIIIKNKPEELALIFWREANTNQALAFNPVSEGILNFGNYSIVLTPIVYYLYLNLVNYKKYAPYLYVVLIGSTMDICRGQFALVFFEVIFVYISFRLIKFVNSLR